MTFRIRHFYRFLALGIISALLLTGCVNRPQDSPEVHDTSLYTGPLPPPAPLPPSPDLPPLPVAPADPHDSAAMNAYNAAVDAYGKAAQANQDKVAAQIKAIKELARDAQVGGKAGVAAWESLLVTAGIAVAGADGKPIHINGKTGTGWPLTDAELRLHSVLAATPGGQRLSDLAGTLGAIPGLDDANFTSTLFSELLGARDREFSIVFWAFGNAFVDGTHPIEPDQVTLSWAQIELLLRRLGAELATRGVADAGAAGEPGTTSPRAEGATVDTASLISSLKSDGKRRPCENQENPWSQEILNQAQKGFSTFVFDLTFKLISDAAQKVAETGSKLGIDRAASYIGYARLIAAYTSFLAKVSSLRATFTIDRAPLVRTKEMKPGEIQNLNISYTFDPTTWGKISECLNLFTGFFGFEMPNSAQGSLSGIDVNLSTANPAVLRVGDGKGGADPVTSGITNGDGVVAFKLSGAPQKNLIPDKATAKDLTVEVKARSDIKGTNFWRDMAALPWDALDVVGSLGLSQIPELLSRTKFITFSDPIPVRDWKLDANFEASVKGDMTIHRAWNEQFDNTCGAPSTILNQSVDGKVSFTSDKAAITAALISNPYTNVGDQAFVFFPLKGTFSGVDIGNGNGLELFDLPVHYTTDKSFFEPATGQQPPLYKGPPVACAGQGDGTPNFTPAPDCGVRKYDGTLSVSMPEARHVYATGAPASESNLWKSCGNPLIPRDPPVAPSMQSCASPSSHGGKVPAINDVFDPAKKTLTIEGSSSCITENPGSIDQVYYNWTLTLCRIPEGKEHC